MGDMDEDDMVEIAATIEILTGGGSVIEQSQDVEDDDGTCELCEREMRRTFHHLIPKETHNKYLKKKQLPENIMGDCNRVWLNTYGAMVCRTCHSAIHNAAPNDELAEKYNTIDLLLTHPKIYAFAKYNSKQPVRQRIR
jgi:serine protease inhibitor ecotin